MKEKRKGFIFAGTILVIGLAIVIGSQFEKVELPAVLKLLSGAEYAQIECNSPGDFHSDKCDECYLLFQKDIDRFVSSIEQAQNAQWYDQLGMLILLKKEDGTKIELIVENYHTLFSIVHVCLP